MSTPSAQAVQTAIVQPVHFCRSCGTRGAYPCKECGTTADTLAVGWIKVGDVESPVSPLWANEVEELCGSVMLDLGIEYMSLYQDGLHTLYEVVDGEIMRFSGYSAPA